MSKQLAEAWFEAFRNKDIAQLERTLAKDFVHTSHLEKSSLGRHIWNW